ncbi:MAG: 30S ribosomal protein S17 [Candidatus Pacebacteria bacterium]|nr:30S ribosomal protein S17 [Candidatus Paceibacterota bacterium]
MKSLTGKVVSAKNKKTVTVLVERKRRHPFYQKIMKIKKKYQVHDELGVALEDLVRIIPSRPISKTKKWQVVEKVGGKKKEKKAVKKTK